MYNPLQRAARPQNPTEPTHKQPSSFQSILPPPSRKHSTTPHPLFTMKMATSDQTDNAPTENPPPPAAAAHSEEHPVVTAASWQSQGYLTAGQLGQIAALPTETAEKVVGLLGPIIESVGPTAGAEALRVTLSSVLDAFTPAASPPEASNIASDAVTRPVSSDSGPSPTSKAKEGVTESEGTTEVKECVVLCVDRSGSMQTPFECDNDPRTKDRTRLESVKQFFYGFRDQTTTYVDGSKHRLGLLSYDNNVTVHTAPTNNFDCFEDVIDDMETGGSTAIYSAICKACDLLAAEGKVQPNADLRVMVLTDGQNNHHEHTVELAVRRLAEVGAVCDALLVGDRCDDGLRQLVAATEGECFQIDSLADAYETLESPAVLSLAARRNGAPKPSREEIRKRVKLDVKQVKKAAVQKGAKVLAPQPQVTTVQRWLRPDQLSSGTSGNGPGQKRLIQELTRLPTSADLASKVHCYAGVDDAGTIVEVKALMTPQKGAYQGRVIEVKLTNFVGQYPFSAPAVTVATPVYHYAISNQGYMCLPLIQHGWSPAITLLRLLDEIYMLIAEHETFDPTAELSIRSWLSELLRVDPAKYYAEAAEHAKANTKVIPQAADVLTALYDEFNLGAAVPPA